MMLSFGVIHWIRFQLQRYIRTKILASGSVLNLFLTTGTMTAETLKAHTLLKKEGIHARVLHMPTIKPLDTIAVEKAAKETKAIITCEEHSVIGGIGDAVAQAISNSPVPMKRIGIQDVFGESGGAYELIEKYGLTAENITKTAKTLIKVGKQ